jgi:glycosyltransferase involved in cell wall biosynthesis
MSTRKLRLLMLGPSLAVKGGITSVERLILPALPSYVKASHIATMSDGSKLTKLARFLWALPNAFVSLLTSTDIVHIHFASRASSVRKKVLAEMALLFGIPVVMHAHGGEYRLYWQEMTERQRRQKVSLFRRIDALIVLGESWRQFFVSVGVSPEKITVLPNPVALPEKIPARQTGPRAQFAYLGLISQAKGAFDLLEAVALLPPEARQAIRVVIAGNGEIARLRAAVTSKGLDSVITVRDWLNPQQRDQLLAESDVFVLPSYNEGLPMSMLEAMAWGLPPLCTSVGSIPEYLTSGVNGKLVKPGDIAGLSGALRELAANGADRIRMGQQARRTVEPLALDRYIEQLCEVYDGIASKEGSARRA